jgi:methyl-accepting chemotaxis protein
MATSNNMLQQWLLRLTEPYSGLTGLEDRRRIRLLSGIQLASAVLSTIFAFIFPLTRDSSTLPWQSSLFYIIFGPAVLASLIYWLTHTRYYNVAVVSYFVTTLLIIFVIASPSIVGDAASNSLALSGLTVLFAGVFAPRKHQFSAGLLMAALVFLCFIVLMLDPLVNASDVFSSLMLTMAMVVFFLAYNWYRNQLTDDLTKLEEERYQAEITRTTEERRSRERLEALVDQYMQFVSRVAEGDLTEHITADNLASESTGLIETLGQNLNSMVDGLRAMATQIQETANQLSQGTTQIMAASSQQLAATTEQDAAINQTVVTVTEIQASASRTADYADNVARLAEEAAEVGQRGHEAVQRSVDGMDLIRERVASIAADILALSERTQLIDEIINSVNDIADQSKLLALNASIEAARAGEEGRGFAVVANEVRELAEQSRQATDRVSDILYEIRQATNSAVMTTEEGIKGVDAGQGLINRAGDSIGELITLIEQAAQAASEIASITHQQRGGMQQLAQAMNSIRQASIETTTGTRQAEQTAQSLNQMAHDMQQAIARYRLE